MEQVKTDMIQVAAIKIKINQKIDLLAAEALMKHHMRVKEFERAYERRINHIFFETIINLHHPGSIHMKGTERLKFAEIR